MHISESKRYYNVMPSPQYFDGETNMLTDSQVCISVPLIQQKIWRKIRLDATLLKKSLWQRCFPVNFAKFLRTPFFIEHLRWLLLLWPFQRSVTKLFAKILHQCKFRRLKVTKCLASGENYNWRQVKSMKRQTKIKTELRRTF